MFEGKTGFAYLNALFFRRHRRILVRPIIVRLAIIAIIFAAAIVASVYQPDVKSLVSRPSAILPVFVFIMNVVPERSAKGSATISTAFIVAATAVTSLLAPTVLNLIGVVLGTVSLAAPFVIYAMMVAGLGIWWVVGLG